MAGMANSFALLEGDEGDDITALVKKIDASFPKTKHSRQSERRQHRGGLGRRYGWDKSGGSGDAHSGYGAGNVSMTSHSLEQRITRALHDQAPGRVSKGSKGWYQGLGRCNGVEKYTQKKIKEEKKVELPSSNMKHELFNWDIIDKINKEAVEEEDNPYDPNNIGVCDVRGASMIDVCSVTIHFNSFADGETCKIYASIYFTDIEGASHHLYEREQSNAETVFSGGNLLLDRRLGGVMAVHGMHIELKDKAHDDAWFANGLLVLDPDAEDSNTGVKSATYEGNLGKVFVDYIALPYAMVAEVKVKLIEANICKSKEDNGSDVHGDTDGYKLGVENSFDADVRGTVVARYGKTYGCKISQRTLFSQLDRPQRVIYGTPIKLSRSRVCAPVYSSLILEVNFRINIGENEIAFDDPVELDTLSSGLTTRRFSRYDVCIEVTVGCYHPYLLFPWKRFNAASSRETNGSQQGFTPHFDKQFSSDMPVCRSLSFRTGIYGSSGIQLFSVLICHDLNEELSFYGTIRVMHTRGTCYVYRKDENCPEVLGQHRKTLSLKGRLNFSVGFLNVFLRLNDVKEHVGIKGYVGLGNEYCFDRCKQLDKPLCSIIKGENGYAAVHYIVFSKALKAMVKIFGVFKDYSFDCANVHGRVVAMYKHYEYASWYESKCFQCVLFDKHENEKEKLTEHCKVLPEAFLIPLSTSVVLVPLTDLVIEVDLHVCCQATGVSGKEGAVKDEHLTGNVEFQRYNDGKSERVEGQYFKIGFSIEWDDDWF